jgi:hypothetical protein
MAILSRNASKKASCANPFCGYVGNMKWQPFLTLVGIAVAVVALLWRSSGKKSSGCGCKDGCTHHSNTGLEKRDALR